MASATAPDPLTFSVRWSSIYVRANEAPGLIHLPRHLLEDPAYCQEFHQAAPAAIAARHGTTAEEVRPILSGAANRAFLLGDHLVLRIPRTKRFLPDLVKEAAVIPAARRAGVRTPDVVTFDDTCSSVDVPYMVLVRAPGVGRPGSPIEIRA